MPESTPEPLPRPRWTARRSLLLAAAIIAAGALSAGGARAQNYPWCSNFADGAGTNCGFSTEAQCRVTIQGSGGYCDRNMQYIRPAAQFRHNTKPATRARRVPIPTPKSGNGPG